MDLQIDADALCRAGVELVLVFGSRARGTPMVGSDLDVGVLFARLPDDPFGAEAVRDHIGSHHPIDIVVLNRADPLLLREAAINGEVAFEAHQGAAEEFRIRAIKRYFDTKWFRDNEAAFLRKRYG